MEVYVCNATCSSNCRQYFSNVHEIMIKNKKVLGPYRVNINGLLATGSVGTGSWQREIPMTLLIAIKSLRNFVSGAYGFL